ncbi:MAG: hypothetical protein AB8B72_01020 [Crocinitomicaceae bacterium]
MKSYVKIFTSSLVILFISCGGEKQSKITEKSSNTTIQEVTPSANLKPIKDPCEALSSSSITSIEGFQKSSEGTPNLASSETWRICDFLVDNKNLSVSIKRHSNRTIETKGLESSYQKSLEIEDKLTRIEAKSTPGDQSIYTYGRKGVIYSYMLQWRYANHTEGIISISFPEEQDADDLLRKLSDISMKLG